MEIRNNAEALKAFLGVSSSVSAQMQPLRNGEAAESLAALRGDQATVSPAATEVCQSPAGPDVRMDKVAVVQQALAAGTYQVAASKVADKVIDAMLAEGFTSKE